jgi:hypothetical protein
VPRVVAERVLSKGTYVKGVQERHGRDSGVRLRLREQITLGEALWMRCVILSSERTHFGFEFRCFESGESI